MRNKNHINMDASNSGNQTLTESYFLSSTTASSNTFLEAECSIDLQQILNEYSSILNHTIEDSKEFTTRQSIIIAGSNIHYRDYKESEIQKISEIRDTTFSNSIENSINRVNLSGMSFCTGKLENSIWSAELTLRDNSNLMSHTGMQLNWIMDNLPNNDQNIENELCPSWDSLPEINFDCLKANPNLTSDESFEILDILPSKTKNCSYEKKRIYDQSFNSKQYSTNLFTRFNTQVAKSNFFTRKKKKEYFPSPRKLIGEMRTKETSENNTEEEFQRIISELPTFSLEDISSPEWPSSIDDAEDENGISMHNDYKNSSPRNSGKYDFGVSAFKFFSRKKVLKYFNTPKK